MAHVFPSLLRVSSLQACRGCLGTDVRLFNIHQNRLIEAYCTLLDCTVKETDDLPHYLCVYCAALLLKCETFRANCRNAIHMFRNAKENHLNLTTENLKMAQTPSYLHETQPLVLNIKSYNTITKRNTHTLHTNKLIGHINTKDGRTLRSNPNNLINTLLKRLTVKYERKPLLKDFNINIDCVINKDETKRNAKMKELLEIIDHIQYSSQTSINLLELLDNDISKTPVDIKDEGSIIDEAETSIDETETNIDETETNIDETETNIDETETNIDETETNIDETETNVEETETKIDETSINDSDSASETNIKDTTPKSILQSDTSKNKANPIDDIPLKIVKEIELKNAKDVAIKRPKRQIKNKNNVVIDNSKMTRFCESYYKVYDIEITNLSIDEQLKVIEGRKESVNYKRAEYKCALCHKGFCVEETFKNHMKLHEDISGKFVCDICHCRFRNKPKLHVHKSKHSRVFTCKQCGHTTRHGHSAILHSKSHTGKKYSCKDCGKEFRNKSSQYGHIKMCHPTSEQLVRCEICGDSFNGLSGLKFHDFRAHKESTSPECLCTVCGTQFYCSDAFKAHQGADGACSSRAKYCVRCGGAFHTQLQLEEHEAEQRKPRDVFECDVCQKVFTNFANCKNHRNQHLPSFTKWKKSYDKDKAKSRNQGSKLMCEICGKVYMNMGNLILHHHNMHSNEKPFTCTECSKTFKSAGNLKTHMVVHTGERAFQCDRCSKAFQHKSNLLRHQLQVHSDKRPYSCDVCGKSFNDKSYIRVHIQTVHMNMPMPPRKRRRKVKKTE